MAGILKSIGENLGVVKSQPGQDKVEDTQQRRDDQQENRLQHDGEQPTGGPTLSERVHDVVQYSKEAVGNTFQKSKETMSSNNNAQNSQDANGEAGREGGIIGALKKITGTGTNNNDQGKDGTQDAQGGQGGGVVDTVKKAIGVDQTHDNAAEQDQAQTGQEGGIVGTLKKVTGAGGAENNNDQGQQPLRNSNYTDSAEGTEQRQGDGVSGAAARAVYQAAGTVQDAAGTTKDKVQNFFHNDNTQDNSNGQAGDDAYNQHVPPADLTSNTKDMVAGGGASA